MKRTIGKWLAVVFSPVIIVYAWLFSVEGSLSSDHRDELSGLADFQVSKGFANYREHRYLEALPHYLLAFALYPRHPRLRMNLAREMEGLGYRGLAIPLARQAVELDPQYDDGLYTLGRLYLKDQRYADAVTYLERSVALSPDSEGVYALGHAQAAKGDTRGAIANYTRYLDMVPHGAHHGTAREYLARHGAPYAVDPNDTLDMLHGRRYADLEATYAAALANHVPDDNGFSAVSLLYQHLIFGPGTDAALELWVKSIEAWQKATPDSPFANACLGMIYIRYGWDARGNDTGAMVTTQGHRRFQERLDKAEHFLQEAYRLEPRDPIVAASGISVAMGRGADFSAVEAAIKLAQAADPTEITVWRYAFEYLSPRWYGSVDQQLEFARRAVAAVPPGTSIARLVAKAHWANREALSQNDYFRDEKIYGEVKTAYEEVLRGFPKSMEVHNWLARTAVEAGDRETARREIDLIGDAWSPNVWTGHAGFEAARRSLSSVQTSP